MSAGDAGGGRSCKHGRTSQEDVKKRDGGKHTTALTF